MQHEERRSDWTFSQGDDGRWSWHVCPPDGVESASVRSFASLNDCVADARLHGYLLPPIEEERRAEPHRPPVTMLSQEVQCPRCRHVWDLARESFVASGDILRCLRGCADFIAGSSNVTCCVEDGEGLREMPLPQ